MIIQVHQNFKEDERRDMLLKLQILNDPESIVCRDAAVFILNNSSFMNFVGDETGGSIRPKMAD